MHAGVYGSGGKNAVYAYYFYRLIQPRSGGITPNSTSRP